MSQSESENKDILSLPIGIQPTNEIIYAQKLDIDNKEQGQSVMYLFFSFDIVNSTRYKTITSYWPIVMESLLGEIKEKVESSNEIKRPVLWRVIGDEIIFFSEIHQKEVLNDSIISIFELTNRMALRLKSGEFFKSIKNQRLKDMDIQQLSFHSPLSLKSTAWIAAVNTQYENNLFNCIKINYRTNANENSIQDFLGSDMDAGFRLKQYTQERRLAISFELAMLLLDFKEKEENNLNIIDYVHLKGVWNEALYPVIWYHNEAVMEELNKEFSIEGASSAFLESFRYDELYQNPKSSNYFARIKQTENTNRKSHTKCEVPLSDSMFEVGKAIKQIIKDRDFQEKRDYLKKSITTPCSIFPIEHPLELHCAVVCCDVTKKQVMIVHRGKGEDKNGGQWEFGCAKAKSGEALVKTIEEYYMKNYAIKIELFCDERREEKQPKPFAAYEVGEGTDNIKKGIIFAGIVQSKEPYRPNTSHDQIKWIQQKDMKDYDDTKTIKDFKKTLETIFGEEKIWGINNEG